MCWISLFFPKAARETVWLEREERARQHYERHLEARKKKLEDQRLKEERRRAAVEEKRRQRLEEDKVWGGAPLFHPARCRQMQVLGGDWGGRSRLAVDSVAAGALGSRLSRGNNAHHCFIQPFRSANITQRASIGYCHMQIFPCR